MYKSIAVNGNNAPGYSSGQAIKTMEELADTVLPEGFGTEWTELTYQQLKAGNLTVATILIIFVPIFYYAIERVRERKSSQQDKDSAPESGQVATESDGKT